MSSKLILALFLSLLVCSCDLLGGGKQAVVLSNQTALDIVVVSLTNVADLPMPVTVPAGQELAFSKDNLKYIEFSVAYDGVVYRGDTGNSDDYSSYKLEFRDDNGILVCDFVANGSPSRRLGLVVSP